MVHELSCEDLWHKADNFILYDSSDRRSLALIERATAAAKDFTLIVPAQCFTIQSAVYAAATFAEDPANAGNVHSVLTEPGTYAGGITLATSAFSSLLQET